MRGGEGEIPGGTERKGGLKENDGISRRMPGIRKHDRTVTGAGAENGEHGG